MIDSAATVPLLANTPPLPQSRVGVICHCLEALLGTRDGIIFETHHIEGFANILFHVGAAVLLGFEHLPDRLVLLRAGKACENSERVSSVVGLPLVAGRTVLFPVPEGRVEVLLDALHACVDTGEVVIFAECFRHEFLPLERQVVPAIVEDGHVLVVAPVSPGPAAFAGHDQPVLAQLPD